VRTSLFDLFKIGIGPSSSHTMGPMRAAREFALRLESAGLLAETAEVVAELYGSLALTGIGHGTDRAVLLGLSGERAEELDPERAAARIEQIRATGRLDLPGRHSIPFEEARHLRFHKDLTLPGHPNAMSFTALRPDGSVALREVYFSIGGGFIQREGETRAEAPERAAVPYPFSNAADLLSAAARDGLSIWQLMLANETALHGRDETLAYIRKIWETMNGAIERGLSTEGILPGGLHVRRRAPRLYARIREQVTLDPFSGMDWVNAFAMAVNEENAAGGRVVTAPTNGAAGVIPAVVRYYRQFVAPTESPASTESPVDAGTARFFLTAAAVGILCKENASISGAEVGCQGEVGVAASMAAAGLVSALEGTNAEVENAAEIAMEHHLGMTCDPIAGLVQIPCIERNALGAVKAINAARLAMQQEGKHQVSLDQVIKTMYETGLDMQARYKETSLAGLAVNAVEC
jgi:L-serine dehydratase